MYAELSKEILDDFPTHTEPLTLSIIEIDHDDWQIVVTPGLESPAPGTVKTGTDTEIVSVCIRQMEIAPIRDEIRQDLDAGKQVWLVLHNIIPGRLDPGGPVKPTMVASVVTGSKELVHVFDDMLDSVLSGSGLPQALLTPCTVRQFQTFYA